MRIKPQKHTLFTLIKMKGSLYFVFTSLFIILFVAYRSKGDPRARLLKMICDQQRMNNQTISITNYVRSMEQVGIQMQTSHSGTAYAGTGSDSSYVLVECNGDLSAQDCILCYAQARTLLTACFPTTGGQILLHGCFARVQNYNFYQEYAGPKDSVSCRNTTRSAAFQNSATQAITNAVRDAPRNKDYFARQVALSDTANESVYVMADCWGTLNETSCTKCLDSAFGLILKCLPLPVGLAFHTGCLIRYSDTNFLNPESASASIGEGNATSQVIQITCGATRANTTSFIPVFVKVMEDISLKINTSNKGKVAIGKEPYITYGLGQCYGNISTTECLLCYAIARASIPSCLPTTGGRVYLNDCFLRYESYNFFGEYTGREDKVICSNSTRRDNAFQQSVETAVHQAVETASIIKNYHIRTKALISGTTNDSVSAVADCLFTLDAEHCGICLQKAAKAMLDCLPATEGYALYTGCFMRYSGSDSSYHHQKALSKGKIFAIAIGVSSIVAFVVAFYAWKIRSKKGKGSNDNKLMKILNSSSLNFKYSTIEKSTNSFDEANKLGQGGFGTVYKGVLPDGKEVAVKRLFLNHRHRAKDFYNEVNIISSVAHKNLVKLVGFSCLGPESILIYEYLPNRSLDNFIFDAVKGKELDWEKRFDIIVGIAEGLAYLHENSKTRIIHRDIKAANILLDSRLRAKISDFGLARSFQKDKNHISTGIAGTLGYMAPEYISHGKLTEKVDVYSFGILLLEVATGMPNRGVQTSEYTHSLVSIAWKHFKQGSVEELFDPVLMLKNQTSSKIKKEIQSVIHIGLLCIQEVASLRPTMSMTLQMLSKNIQPLPSPANPPYLPENSIQLNGYGPIHRENNHASVPTVSNSSFTPR